MANKEKESVEVPTTPQEAGLVRLSQETGLGMKLSDGTVIDLSGIDMGLAQTLEYLIKELANIRKNIG